MKGGKREGAGRKPSATPYAAQPTLRMTPDQYQRLKALGGAAWVRQQIDAAGPPADPAPQKTAGGADPVS